MKKLLFLLSLLSSVCLGGVIQLPDDKVDTTEEVGAINQNFQTLNNGKLDLKPGGIIPKLGSAYDLGSNSVHWRGLFIDTITVTGLTVSTLTVTSSFTATSGNFTGALSAATLNTGQGANELYDMNQNVQTSDDVQFNTVKVATGSTPGTAVLTVNGQAYYINATGSGQILFSTRTTLTNGNWRIGSIAGSGHFFLADQIGDRSAITVYGAGATANRRLELWTTGADNADVELEISNSGSTGGGTAHAATFAAHSKRDLKSDIAYLTSADELQAYNNILALQPATWRYKREIKNEDGTITRIPDPSQPLKKGVIWEDAPPEIKAADGTISLNDQIVMLQLALKEAIRQIEELKKKQ